MLRDALAEVIYDTMRFYRRDDGMEGWAAADAAIRTLRSATPEQLAEVGLGHR